MAGTGKWAGVEMPGLGSGPVDPAWLLIVTQAVLVSPFPRREEGPTGDEVESILSMQRRLQDHAVTVSIDPETGWVEAHTISADALNQAASRSTTVRMRRCRSAA